MVQVRTIAASSVCNNEILTDRLNKIQLSDVQLIPTSVVNKPCILSLYVRMNVLTFPVK